MLSPQVFDIKNLLHHVGNMMLVLFYPARIPCQVKDPGG